MKAITKAQHIPPVTITFDPLAVESATAAAIEELNALQDVAIESDEDEAEAAAVLRDIVREKDAIEALLARWLAPVKAQENQIKAAFKPALDAKVASERKLKDLIGAWQLAKKAERRKALAAATAAAQARNPEAIATALVAASAAAPRKLEGVGVRAVWKVKRIAEDLLTREWLCPDEKKIAAYARAFDPDKDPNGTVPGVVFELDASVSAKR